MSSFLFTVSEDLYEDGFSDLALNNLWNVDIMIDKKHREGRRNAELSLLYNYRRGNDPFLFDAMDVQFAFCPYLVFTVLVDVNFLNKFPRERCFGKWLTFHVVRVEVLALQCTVKAHKRIDGNCKSKSAFLKIDQPLQFG